VKVLNIKALYDFDGYVVDKISCQTLGEQVNLEFDGRCGPRCWNCGTRLPRHRCRRQTAADLSIASGLIVYISFPVVQGRCGKCKHFATSRPKEIHSTKDATWRLMRRVSQMAKHVPVTAVAEMMSFGESTVRRYDMAVLKEDLPEPKLDGLRVLIIDEKSIRRGHGYLTLVLNGEMGELLQMAEGKKKASLESFFEKLTEEQKASIEAVCIDRAGSYQSVVGEQIPKAAIVYDHFHLNLNTAVDEVRRQEWRKAKEEDKLFIKGNRFILLANEENLDDKGSVKLAAIQKMPLQQNLWVVGGSGRSPSVWNRAIR
jgi:transposase